MSDEQLNEWRAVADKATPGPWRQGDTVPGGIWAADNPKHLLAIGPASRGTHADAAFIAVARTAVPELIAEVARLRAALTQIGTMVVNPFMERNDATRSMQMCARAALGEVKR